MALTKHKSESVSQRRETPRTDERVRRTRQRLDAAFVELVHRRAYADIRVSDIVKKAGVGRPTFYAHFATKDDLLRSQLERVVAPMLRATADDSAKLDATNFFKHVGTAPQLFRNLMGPNSGTAPRVIRNCFEHRVREVLRLDSTEHSEMEQTATARLIASALMAVVECWIEHGTREAPQQVQALFAGLIAPGLQWYRRP